MARSISSKVPTSSNIFLPSSPLIHAENLPTSSSFTQRSSLAFSSQINSGKGSFVPSGARTWSTSANTKISLALDDGADASHLRWVTHAPPASAFDGYARGQWARLCAEVSKLQVRAPGRGLVEGCRGSGRGFGEGEKPHEKPLKASESGESVEGCRGLFDMTALLSVEKNKVSTAGGEAGGGSAFGSAHAPAEHGAIPDETRDAWRKHRGIEGPPGGTDMVRSGSNWHQVEDTHPPVQAMTGDCHAYVTSRTAAETVQGGGRVGLVFLFGA